MPKSEEEKWKQRLGKPLNIAYSVWERKLLRAHPFPYPPPSSFCPSTLRLHCFRHSLKSKHLFVKAGRVASTLSNQGEADGIALTWLTSNLHSEVLGHHAVPGSQISVDKFVGIQVRHAVGDFPCHLDHLFERGQDLAGGVLWQSERGWGERVRSTKNHCSVSPHVIFFCFSPHTQDTGYRSASQSEGSMLCVWKCACGWGRKTEKRAVRVWQFTPSPIPVRKRLHLF